METVRGENRGLYTCSYRDSACWIYVIVNHCLVRQGLRCSPCFNDFFEWPTSHGSLGVGRKKTRYGLLCVETKSISSTKEKSSVYSAPTLTTVTTGLSGEI